MNNFQQIVKAGVTLVVVVVGGCGLGLRRQWWPSLRSAFHLPCPLASLPLLPVYHIFDMCIDMTGDKQVMVKA